jgi:hypothetical protein
MPANRLAGERLVLKRITPIQYDRQTTRGRTEPSFITCQDEAGATVEVVAKFSAGCDQGEINLAREVIGACLAGDLGLPIPEPFLIDIPPEWIETVQDAGRRSRMHASLPVAFGSRLAGNGFAAWNAGNLISDIMLPLAAAIFTFDGIIQNPDRRADNPNCLVRGDTLRIFDHELAFSHDLMLGWQPPWALGGLKPLETSGSHIFRAGLKGRPVDLAAIRAPWAGLSDARIRAYEEALPPEWSGAAAAVASATKLIRDARDNIDACLTEIKRVLA